MTEAQKMANLADEIERSRGLLSMDQEPIGGTTQLGIRSTTLVIKALRACSARPVGYISQDGLRALQSDNDATICCDNSASGFNIALYASTAADQPVAWQPLSYSRPADLVAAFKNGSKFVLYYHGKTFDIAHMEAREHVVYVQPPPLPVKVRADGSSAEGTSKDIWLGVRPND